MRLAILMTCHNRKDKTIECLKKLEFQLKLLPGQVLYKFYICDDGSNDGTGELITKLFPDAILIRGNGNLFWCKGMHLAMAEAVKENYDYFLMVNDDVDFNDDAAEIMLDSFAEAGGACAIVGTTASKELDILSYGGRNMINEDVLIPNGHIQPCVYANWNCFLVPVEVVDRIGLLDRHYEHAFGDYDYCLRMKKRGIPIYIASKGIGFCEKNDNKGTYKDNTVSVIKRLKKLMSPKGMPFRSYMRFNMMQEGFGKGILFSILGYLSMIKNIFIRKEL